MNELQKQYLQETSYSALDMTGYPTKSYMYWLEAKVLTQSKPEVSDGFLVQELTRTLGLIADELVLANSRLGWKESMALNYALGMLRKIVTK